MKTEDIIRMAHDIVEQCAVENDFVFQKSFRSLVVIEANVFNMKELRQW